MKRRWLRLAAVPIVCSLVAVACSDDDDDDAAGTDTEATSEGTSAGTEGTTAGSETEGTGAATPAEGSQDFEGAEVNVTSPERDDPSVVAINTALKAFGDANNINITFSGDADWEANINTQVEGGNPPNIGVFPQPGKLADFARAGSIFPLADNVVAAVNENWSEDYSNYGVVDDQLYGVPVKTDLKSLVWYKPAAFEAAGYEVPTTWDEFNALIEQMKTDGGPKPLCVGIESGNATGWTYTDWTEELVLRQQGGDVYDQWVSHEIPFNDERIVGAMQTVLDLWSDDNVFAAGGNIAATAFQDNAQPLLDEQCFMHRQASFFSGMFPAGTAFADGSPDAIDVFYFPDINGDKPVLTAGTYAAAFDEEPATMAVLAYMATPEYANLRQATQTAELDGGLSGFLSAVEGGDPSVYQPLEQNFLEILNASELSRFDGSDLMPADVGSGSFWTEATSAVNGDEDAQAAADNIEASWPA